MKRKVILGIILTVPLLFLTIIAVNTSTFALSQDNNISDSNNLTNTGADGIVIVQLPTNSSPPAPPGGTPDHPTILELSAEHFDKGTTEGGINELVVFMWRPVVHRFEPVAMITDDANHAAFLETLWNKTYLWYPVGPPTYPPNYNLFPNVIQVEPKDLQVWTELNGHKGASSAIDTLNANLTKAITITLPNYNATGVYSNQTFILPPLSLMFKATSSEFNDPMAFELKGYPGSSNYTFVRSGSSQFAAVRVTIPAWLSSVISGPSSGYLEATGHVYLHFVDTYTPPASVSSWFSNPFGPVWGTHDEGAMSIYASGASNTFGNTNIGTIQDGNDANAKSASYFKCSQTGTVTDIFAYVARVGAAGNGAAAIYADNAGSPGALIASTNQATVGTAYSWVDFHLPSPVSVTAGTGYWLAISSNNALNLNTVAGSGVRVHNGV
jgi:hypothetical protein